MCLQENYLQSGKRKRLSWRHSTNAGAEEGLMELPDPERELAMRSAIEPSLPKPCKCLRDQEAQCQYIGPCFLVLAALQSCCGALTLNQTQIAAGNALVVTLHTASAHTALYRNCFMPSVIMPICCQAVSGCPGGRRAKNREAARQSRLRKVLRIEALQRTVADLQAENELLLQCVQEISVKASAAQAEQRLLRVRAQMDWQRMSTGLCQCCNDSESVSAECSHEYEPDATHSLRG